MAKPAKILGPWIRTSPMLFRGFFIQERMEADLDETGVCLL